MYCKYYKTGMSVKNIYRKHGTSPDENIGELIAWGMDGEAETVHGWEKETLQLGRYSMAREISGPITAQHPRIDAPRGALEEVIIWFEKYMEIIL